MIAANPCRDVTLPNIFLPSLIANCERIAVKMYLFQGSWTHSSVMLKSTGSGAGSGGSVWITTGYLRGHGSISARGGVGNTASPATGGSGSGGRIAVHVTIKDEYRGGFYALGGVSPGSQHGGSGTVYIEEIQGDRLFRRLYIDNQNANPPKVFLLDEMNPKTLKANTTEENGAEFGFDELMLQGDVSTNLLRF